MTAAAIRIVVETSPSAADCQTVFDGLRAFNTAHVGDPRTEEFTVFARDPAGAVVGGLMAEINWGWLYVGRLWVTETFRGQGLGRRLLDAAEAWAWDRGSRDAGLHTFGFQARGFYERHGYAVYGVLEGFPPGSRTYFMRKRLGSAVERNA